MILPFFGGFLVDKLGCRVMVVFFSALLVLGQAVFAFGTSIDSYFVMILGRIFYGFGGESLCVAAQTMLAEWFMGMEMAMAMVTPFNANLTLMTAILTPCQPCRGSISPSPASAASSTTKPRSHSSRN